MPRVTPTRQRHTEIHVLHSDWWTHKVKANQIEAVVNHSFLYCPVMEVLCRLPENLVSAIYLYLPSPLYLEELKTMCGLVCWKCEWAFHAGSKSFLCVALDGKLVVVCGGCLNKPAVVHELRALKLEARHCHFEFTELTLPGPELFDDDDEWGIEVETDLPPLLRFPRSRRPLKQSRVTFGDVQAIYGPFCSWPPRMQDRFPLVRLEEELLQHVKRMKRSMDLRDWGMAADALLDARQCVHEMRDHGSEEELRAKWLSVIDEMEATRRYYEEGMLFMATKTIEALNAAWSSGNIEKMKTVLASGKMAQEHMGSNFRLTTTNPVRELKKAMRAVEKVVRAAHHAEAQAAKAARAAAHKRARFNE